MGNKKCRIYAACGVSQTPKRNIILVRRLRIGDICMDFMMEIGNCSKIYIELLTIKKIGADRRT